MSHLLDRREFTARGIRALFAGVVITVSDACGGGGSSNPTAPSGGGSGGGGGAGSGDVNGSISANHGHTAVVTRTQLNAGGGVTLNITGQADHPHTVNLSSAQVSQIAAGQRVSVVSSENVAHDHTVVFN